VGWSRQLIHTQRIALRRTVAFVKVRGAAGKGRSASSNTMSSADCPYTAVCEFTHRAQCCVGQWPSWKFVGRPEKAEPFRATPCPSQSAVSQMTHTKTGLCALPESGLALSQSGPQQQGIGTIAVKYCVTDTVSKSRPPRSWQLQKKNSEPGCQPSRRYSKPVLPDASQLGLKRHSRHSSVDAVTTLAEWYRSRRLAPSWCQRKEWVELYVLSPTRLQLYLQFTDHFWPPRAAEAKSQETMFSVHTVSTLHV
jgi:hypothetical protein